MGNHAWQTAMRTSAAVVGPREQAESLAGTTTGHMWTGSGSPGLDVLYREITAVLDGGAYRGPAGSGARPQALRHRQPVLHPVQEAYVGMSLFYAEDGAMKAFHDSYHPRMVEFRCRDQGVRRGSGVASAQAVTARRACPDSGPGTPAVPAGGP
ncbi:hypothetical protein GCM10020229_14550 [Kitasatospora albolonga]